MEPNLFPQSNTQKQAPIAVGFQLNLELEPRLFCIQLDFEINEIVDSRLRSNY